MVFVALLSRIIHALSVWGWHFTRQLQELLDAFLKRARKFGFCDANCNIAELFDKADAKLFGLVQRPEHCLYHLLPDTIDNCSMELRHRDNSFPLHQCKYNLYKTSLSHGVCLNTFSFSNVMCVHACPCFSCDACVCRAQIKCLLTYVVGTSKSLISSLISLNVCSTLLRSSLHNLLHVPFTTTAIGCKAFSFAAPTVWNSIPLCIRQSPSIGSFKRHLKTHLFTLPG